MNYLPYSGSWFYGGGGAAETAAYFCSWGLLGDAPAPPLVVGLLKIDSSKRPIKFYAPSIHYHRT